MLNYQRVNLHFPMVFLWFSHFPWFSHRVRVVFPTVTTVPTSPRRCLAPGRWALRTEPRLRVEGSGAVQGTSGKCRGSCAGDGGRRCWGTDIYIYIVYYIYNIIYMYIYTIYYMNTIYIWYIWSQKSSWWLNITFWTQLFDVPKRPFKWLFLWVHLLIPGILPQALLKEAFDASAESMSGAETFLLGFLGFTLFSCFRRGYFALT